MTPIDDLPTLCAALMGWAALSAIIGIAWEAVDHIKVYRCHLADLAHKEREQNAKRLDSSSVDHLRRLDKVLSELLLADDGALLSRMPSDNHFVKVCKNIKYSRDRINNEPKLL